MPKPEAIIATPPVPLNSNVALAKASLFKFAGLLGIVFILATGLLFFVAKNLDSNEESESAFYAQKAVESLEKNLRSTIKDYAFWGDGYLHLHKTVDTDWAFTRQNLGPTLYSDFGLPGLFVVNAADRTVYSV